jgi:ABC-type antimicrobial peptide transport system permease subunit
VRAAMGAHPRDILRLILRESARLTLTGTVAGLILAALSTRIVAHQVYNMSPLDPLTFGGVPILLLLVALLASCVPARRAARVDPMVALRYE